MIRSLLAVLAGYLTFGVSSILLFRLSGRDPHVPQPSRFLAVAVLWGVAFAALGGYLAAAIARYGPMQHAIVLAALLAAVATGSMLLQPSAASLWSEVSVLVCMAPAAVLGGYLRVRIMRGRAVGR